VFVEQSAACPECAAPVVLASGFCPSEIVECVECLSELEIQSVDPPVLGLAPEVEDDWGE
jgi:alpha-aminoadipate carrier protein LysW